MRTNKRKFLLWMALPALLLCSCISEQFDGNDPHPNAEEETSVRVSLLMPASSPKTYAISEIDENEVSTVDVLAFKPVTPDAQHPSGWAFAYKAAGTAITAQPGDNPVKAKKQFTVTLIKNTTQQLFVVLANIRDEVDALGDIAQGADRDELLARLVIENTGSWNANNDGSKQESDPNRFRPFPMWGEVAATLTDGVTEISDVKILRSIARLDVVLGEQVLTDDNFTLDEIYIYNSKNKGFAVPDPANISGGKATAATVPANVADYALWNNAAPLVYDVPVAINTAFERTVYIFEAKAVAQDKSSEATCIVVGGTYGTDATPTYYRLDFLESDKKTYKDILRNHRYRANITKVDGRGYATPEDAFNSKSLNILAEILEWDDGAIGDIVFDGQYYLGVSQAEYELTREARTATDEDNKLSIFTDYPTGWTAAAWDDPAGTTPVTNDNVTGTAWLSIDVDEQSGQADIKETISLLLAENTTGADRTAYIRITAGRLIYKVKVTQTSVSNFKITVTDVYGNPVTELVFGAHAGESFVPSQLLNVKWAPADAVYTVQVTQIGSSEFDFGTGDLPSKLVTTPGEIFYSIQPPTMNPLMIKTSKLDLQIEHAGEYRTASIFLRQGSFDLIPGVLPAIYNYPLDGQTYYFTFSTNTAWEAVFGGNTDVITSGIAVRTGVAGTDQAFGFTLADDRTSPEGTVKVFTVTFRSPTGQFADRVVTVNTRPLYLRLSPDTYPAPGYAPLTFSLDIITSIPLNLLTASIPNNANGIIKSAIVNLTTGKLDVTLGAAQMNAQSGSVQLAYSGITATATISRIADPYAISSGRIWAQNDIPPMAWAEAMGIPTSFNILAFEQELYTPTLVTGCAAYREGDEPDPLVTGQPGPWRVPTRAELMEIYNKRGLVGMVADAYYSSYDVETLGGEWAYGVHGGTGSTSFPYRKTDSHLVRCVRAR